MERGPGGEVLYGALPMTSRPDLITINGINGDTGTYLTAPLPVEQFVEAARRHTWNAAHWGDLQARVFARQANYGVLPWFQGEEEKNRESSVAIEGTPSF